MGNIRVKCYCNNCTEEISYDIPGANDIEKFNRAKKVVDRKRCPFCKKEGTMVHISSDPLIS